MPISNAIKLYILFDTDSQEPLLLTTDCEKMTTEIQSYGENINSLELRIYEEKDNGDLGMSERIPFPVVIEGMFMTHTANTPLEEEPDYGVYDTDFVHEEPEEDDEEEDKKDSENNELDLDGLDEDYNYLSNMMPL